MGNITNIDLKYVRITWCLRGGKWKSNEEAESIRLDTKARYNHMLVLRIPLYKDIGKM